MQPCTRLYNQGCRQSEAVLFIHAVSKEELTCATPYLMSGRVYTYLIKLSELFNALNADEDFRLARDGRYSPNLSSRCEFQI